MLFNDDEYDQWTDTVSRFSTVLNIITFSHPFVSSIEMRYKIKEQQFYWIITPLRSLRTSPFCCTVTDDQAHFSPYQSHQLELSRFSDAELDSLLQSLHLFDQCLNHQSSRFFFPDSITSNETFLSFFKHLTLKVHPRLYSSTLEPSDLFSDDFHSFSCGLSRFMDPRLDDVIDRYADDHLDLISSEFLETFEKLPSYLFLLNSLTSLNHSFSLRTFSETLRSHYESMLLTEELTMLHSKDSDETPSLSSTVSAPRLGIKRL